MITTDRERRSDLADLREVLRDFFAKVDPHAGIDLDARVDRTLWSSACTALGAAGVDVPESRGGTAIGAAALAVLQEEAGRTLARLPVLGTVVVTIGSLVAADDADDDPWLEELLSGERVVAFCPAPSQVATAERRAGAWTVSGTLWPVLDGVSADDVLVLAATPDGPTVLRVDLGAPGVAREACRTLDLTRDAARISLDAVAGQPIGPVGGGAELLTAVRPRLDLALAAEALGSAEACLASAVEYAGDRVQFGRAIGSFQAVKHRLADLAALIDDARSAVEHAAWCADEQPADAALSAAIAVATATAAHLRATADAIQVHGGIGFTWEHPDHLHLRRSESNALLFGDVPRRREQVLRLMGL